MIYCIVSFTMPGNKFPSYILPVVGESEDTCVRIAQDYLIENLMFDGADTPACKQDIIEQYKVEVEVEE